MEHTANNKRKEMSALEEYAICPIIQHNEENPEVTNLFKILKRASALTIALAAAIALTSCGTDAETGKNDGEITPNNAELSVSEIFEKAMENTASIKSASYSIGMDMEMSSEGTDFSIATTGNIKMTADPMEYEMTLDMNMGEEIGSMTTTSYLVNEDGKQVLYSGVVYGGETFWSKQYDATLDSFEQYNAMENIEMYLENAESFKENGTDDINGTEAVRYDGTITGESLENAINSTLGDLGTSIDGTDLSASEIFNGIGDLTLSVWIDRETLTVRKYEMDMSEIMSKLFENMSADDESLAGIDVSKVFLSMTVSSYNDIDSITVPDDVKSAAEQTDLYGDVG